MVPFTHLSSIRLNSLPAPLNFILLVGIVGLMVYTAGLFHLLRLPIAVFLVLLMALGLLIILMSIPRWLKLPLTFPTRILLTVLAASLGLNLLGVFVPETGFDALWYHLPLAQVYQATGSIQPVSELLYSTMPRLGEMYFTLAFFAGSPALVKSISYFFYLLFLYLAYRLARRSLFQPASFLLVATLSSYLVIAWQASSAYVDLIQSVFELSALWMFFHSLSTKNPKKLLFVGIFTGFALAVKFQAFFGFFSLLSLVILIPKTSFRQKVIYLSFILIPAVLVASPWYLQNYLSRGHFFYPVNHPALRQDVLAYVHQPSYLAWLFHQFFRLPFLIPTLSFLGRDLTSPIILILSPLALLVLPRLWKKQRLLLIYTGIYLLVWWFFPPLEVRYALTPLASLTLILFQAIYLLPSKFSSLKLPALTVIFLALILNLSLRFISSLKFFPVLLGGQSSTQYLETQTTDFSRHIIEKYYSGYYQNYNYPVK